MSFFRKLLRKPEQNSGEVLVQHTALRISNEDNIRRIIRQEIFRNTINREAETFEEADDFEFDDGEQWVSPYEEQFDPELIVPPVPPDTTSTANPDTKDEPPKSPDAGSPT